MMYKPFCYLAEAHTMTIRMLLDRKKRWIMTVAIFGFAIAFGGGILAQQNVLNMPAGQAALPGFVLFMLVLFYGHSFAFRCPQCRKYLGLLVMNGGFPLNRCIRYCPFCGT